ncbi:MAG: hypothetical protein IPP72_08520 [Chitinophagaceae bacterium]|nr:hypothetical protein [Chitinophagaceae bacterium]
MCAATPGCRTAADFVISNPPTITTSATAANVCYNSSAQNSSLSYSATTNSPTNYTITWDAAALSAGLVNVSTTALPASPITVPVAANVAAGTYTGTLTVINAAGCTSSGNSFTVTINALPTITASATALSKCFSSSAQNSTLNFTATTGSPTNYTITWDATALSAGLVNVGSTVLPASPIVFSIAGGVTAGTYNGTLRVTNSNGCSSTANAFTVTIVGLPTITASSTAAPKCFSSSAQNSSLTYSATSGSPTQYTITWDVAAQLAGLVNLGITALPASPLTIPIAAGVAAGTYNGAIHVMNGFGCYASATNAFTLTISNTYPVMTSASTASICSGGTVSIPLTSDIASAYTWIATDNTNVTGESTSLQTTSTLSNTLIATSGTAETVNYTVTPTSTGGCTGTPQSVVATIAVTPTITSAATAASVCFSSSAQNSSLIYSATTNSPTSYTITWNAAALSAGLVNVGSTVLPASPISVPVAAGVVAGTYTGTLTVSNATCSSAGNTFTLTIGGFPTITSSAAAATRCYNASSSQNSTLSYSATTNSPTNYSITWNAAALTAGLVNVSSTALPASPIPVPIAAGVGPGTFTGTLYVTNAAGCSSTGNSFTVTIVGNPSIFSSAAATAKCFSSSAQNSSLAYSGVSNSPTNYTITWNAAALTAGLVNVGSTALPASPIPVPVAANVAVGTYTGTLNVTNAAGCSNTGNSFTITINALPTITTSATATAKCFSSSGQTSTLSYSATTNSPTNYSITWNAAALSAGLVNVSSTALPASQVTFPIAAGVAAGTYTGTITVTNANGCSSAGNSFTLTINSAATITTQPTDQTVCAGSSVSFSVAATGTSLTYQWRKGTTNLCNCGTASGATSATLTINPAAVGDAASNYNCVVTSAGCSGIITNYVTLTVNASSVAPTAQPKDLVFPTVGVTSILASFTASSDAARNLVVRTATNTAPTNPSNGTTYTAGTSALGGYIEYAGPGVSFTSNGLTPGTTYYYWVYGYNTSSCGTSPLYLTSSPLTGDATTATNVACGTVTTLYWGGTGSGLTGAVSGTDFNTASNWSTSSSTYVASLAAPSQCNNVSLALNNNATITISSSVEVYGLTFTIAGNNRKAILSTEGNTLTVNANAVIDIISGNENTRISIGENSSGAGVVDFKANFKIGERYFSHPTRDIPQSCLIGNLDSKITFRGDVMFGRTAKFILPAPGSYPPSYPVTLTTATTPGTIEFDGQGLQQILWNNNYYYDNFYNMVVGNQNQPYVKHVTGTYTPDNILNDFTINDGCTVDIGTSQWIREQQGGTFTMNGTAKLILGNNLSVQSSFGGPSGTGITIPGSNFPGGFSTMDISPNSTIEYNGSSSITQTVYGTPSVGSLTYGNLILSNTNGTGTANKISTSTINAAGTITISDKTTMTPGAGIVSEGDMYVNSGGRLTCGTQIVSGNGSFNILSGGTISMASTAGITASGATGNIQTISRSFGTGGNYIYNASTAQATGNGLPTTVNNLTISNAAGVTMYAASANYTVDGILNLTSGALSINGNTLNINSLQRSSGTLTGSSTSSVGVNSTSVPLFFTSGGRILKNLTVNASASADLQTALAITAGSSAGSLSIGSGATLNTYDNLTLKSDANGTARVAEIPVDGSGNALGTVTGNVQIERYIPAKRGWRMLAMPVNASGAPTINASLQEGAVNTDLIYANNQNPNPGFGIHISGSSPALGFDPTPLNNPSMLTFTRATGAWAGIANTLSTTVRDYEGYMVFVRGNRSVNLSLNTSAALSNSVLRVLGNLRTGRQTISVTGGTGTYSVVGNPFVSTIDFRNVSTTGSASSSNFVMWDPSLTGAFGVGGYQYFTQVGGPGSDYTVFPGGGSYGSAGTVNNNIQAAQAFMIQNSGAGTVIIN